MNSSRQQGIICGLRKSVSIWLVVNFLVIFVFPPSLVARPFRDFQAQDERELKSYLDRAAHMPDLDQWRSYVQAGLVSLQADWEEDAARALEEREDRIREDDLTADKRQAKLDALETAYETARLDWETEASQLILEREAGFRLIQEKIQGLQISEQEYEEIIATAEATFENKPQLDLDGWESLVAGLNASLVESFEEDLEAKIAKARENIGPLEDSQIQALDRAIEEKEEEIRSEFEMREHFYLLRARNRYIALKRTDDLSAKVQADSGSAEEIGNQAIQEAEDLVEEQTSDLLKRSEEALHSEDTSPDPLEYQKQVEAIISEGLRVFQQAEEDLYRDRLVWMEATKTARGEAEEIWQDEHAKLKTARDNWLREVQTKIEEGRAKYAEKHREFEENRAQAEADLQDYVQQERDGWDRQSEQLASMVRGGGAALLEAREARDYYQELLVLMGNQDDEDLYDFYQKEAGEMEKSINRFEAILLRAQRELNGTLYSDEPSSGLLIDRREFGEELRQEFEELDEDDFRNELTDWLSDDGNRTEYALYVRDIESDIRSNRLFVNRARKLKASTDFNYRAMDSIEEMRELVAGLDQEYLEHGIEISELINEIIDRNGGAEELWPEDADEGSPQAQQAADLRQQVLSEIKEAMGNEFFAESSNEGARLRDLILGKLEDGLYRQHITGNANDPYLMTDAEYEWEVLRRERDRQAQRLQRARRVKHYADVAEKHGAGLEMAAVTDWRVEATRLKTDLLQLAYDVAAGKAGDLAHQLQSMHLEMDTNPNPDVDRNLDPDSEQYQSLFDELIQKQTDFDRYSARGKNLEASSDFISDVAGLDSETGPGVDDLNEMLGELDSLLNEYSGDDASAHPLIPFRNRLQSFRDENLSGQASASTLANRWKALHGTAWALSLEMEKLAGEFNYTEERELIQTALSQPNLKQREDALGDLKDDLESRTEALRLAEERLNESREAYKQARIDLEIQNSGETRELIQIELRNAASALGNVMTQMKTVEDAADVPLQTRVESAKDAYFDTIRQKRESDYQRKQTRQALGLVEALNNTMQAGAALRGLQDSEDYPQGAGTPENAEARARAILEIREDIAKAASPGVSGALSSLQGRLDLLESLQETIEDADTQPQEKAHAADKKERALTDLEDDITALQDSLKSTEETVRLALLKKLDREPDESDVPTKDDLKERSEELRDEMLEFAELASTDLELFLTEHRGESYSAMIAALDSAIATAADATTPTGKKSQANDAAGNRDGENTGDDAIYQLQSLQIIKDWIIDNRKLIQRANAEPGPDEPTATEKRWDDILDRASRLKESSTYWLEFENTRPESSGDDWVTEFRSERKALRDTLESVLSAGDGAVENAFYGLSMEERQLLLGYKAIRTDNATYLRRDLIQIRDLIQRDLDQLDTDFETIFEREEAKSLARQIQRARKELAETHPEYGETRARINLLRTQILEMQEEIEAADASERATLDAKYASDIEVLEKRIGELQDIVEAAKPDVESRQSEIRRLSAYLQELEGGKGSSSRFMNSVRSVFTQQLQELKEEQQRRALLNRGSPNSGADRPSRPVVESLGLALGVFVSDADGDARKSGDTYLISDEFSSLGLADVESLDDIAGTLNESLPGPVLEALSENLLDYASDPENSGRLSEEMRTAMMMLQGHLIDVAAAREIIDMRDSSLEEIRDRADRMKQNSAHLQEALPGWKNFDDEIMQALQKGASASAVLAILDSQENFELLEEEARRNVDGDETTDVPEAIQQRLSLYKDAHARLRNYRTDQVLASALSHFQSQLQSELNPNNDFEARKDPEYYLSSLQILDFDDAISVINSLSPSVDPDSDETLRSRLTARLPELASGSISRSIIMEIMVNEPELTGDALKAALIQDLNDAQSELIGSLDEMMQAARTAETLFSYLKGADGKNGAWDGELASLTDTQKEKAFIIALQKFEAESSKRAFNPESYPEEFLDLLMVRGSELAEERYEDFLKGQDLPGSVSEEGRPGLNLSGIPVFFQKQILARDFHAFLDGFASLSEFDSFSSLSGISNSEILDTYFESRKMEPHQTALLSEILSVRQWNDMKEDASEGSGSTGDLSKEELRAFLISADESEYSADFQEYIFALRLQDFLSNKTVIGSTAAEQKESFSVLFNQFLDDPAYAVHGQSMRERIASIERTRYLKGLGFEIHRQDLNPESRLPGALYQRFLDGELSEPAPDENSVLPDEFAGIVANHSDYLSMAEALTDSSQADSGGEENFVQILALLETGGQGTLYHDPGQADRILVDTGYDNLSEPALSFVRSYINRDSVYLSVGGADLQTAIVETETAAITRDFFPTEGELLIHQAFLEDHGADLSALSAALSETLEANPDFNNSPLFAYYLNQRGDLVQSLLETSPDDQNLSDNDFYDSLGASAKADFVELQTSLMENDLLTEELQRRSDKVALSVNHSAMQNLANSGTIPALVSMALGYFSQRLSDADFAILKENRHSLGRALMSAIFENGDEVGLSGALPGIFTNSEVTDGMQELVLQMGPQFKAGILDQAELWRVYLKEYAMDDGKRSELEALIEESQRRQKRLEVDLFSGSADGVDSMQERLENSGEGSAFILEMISGFLQSDTESLESLANQADRDFKIATRLGKFADLRGTRIDSNGKENLTVNRFVNYRTYAGAERDSQLNSYKDYLRGYNPGLFVDPDGRDRPILDAIMEKVASGETVWVSEDGIAAHEVRAESDWDMDSEDALAGAPVGLTLAVGDPREDTGFQQFAELTGTAVIEVEEVDLQDRNLDNLFDSDDWEEILASDPPSQGQNPGTADNSRILENGEGINLEVRSPVVRAVMPYRGRAVESLEGMRRVYYANLANNYLDSVTRLHNALRTVMNESQATSAQQATLLKTEMSDAIVSALTTAEENRENGHAAPAINSENFEDLDYEELKTLLEHEENVAAFNETLQTKEAALTGEIDGLNQDRASSQQAYQSALAARNLAQKEFAQAGRRQESQNRAVRDYFNTVMVAVEQDYEGAREDYQQAKDQANELRHEYQKVFSNYTRTMDQMSAIFEKVNASQQELDTRSRVQEYANTPYLYASADSGEHGFGDSQEGDSSESEKGHNGEDPATASVDAYALHSEDADVAFERALAAYNSIQRQFKQAGFDVLVQDDLEDFARVAQLRKEGNDLLDEELEEDDYERLAELQESRHSDFEGHQPYETVRNLFRQLGIEQLQVIAELGADPDDWELSDGLEQYREELKEIHGYDPAWLDSEDEAPKWQIADEAELYLLTLRDVNQRNGELIDARADYIFHTQRTVRLEKAARLVQAEIDKRKAAVEKARAEFDQIYKQNFGDMSGGENEAEKIKAREFVYRKMAAMLPPLDAGSENKVAINLGAEYASWFYGAGTVADEINRSIWGGNLDPNLYQWSPMQNAAAALGLTHWNAKSEKEKQAIRTWMEAGGGTALGYNQYVPVHMTWMQSLGQLDRAILENHITRSIWLPVLYDGAATAALDYGARYRQAAKMLAQGEAKLVLQQTLSFAASLNVGQAGDNSKVADVRRAEMRYERAQSELDYLTKAPDLHTLKSRLREFGAVERYELTEDELKYLYDAHPDQTGVDEDRQGDALNVSGLATKAKCFSSTGGRYSCNPDSTESGGLHEDNVTGEMVTIVSPSGDTDLADSGEKRQRISDDAEIEEIYDLGRVLKAMVSHGNTLREQARESYINAGTKTEGTFALAERSATIKELVQWASGDDPETDAIETSLHGGREFKGYQTTYLDQLEIARRIQGKQLEQQKDLQKRIWDARKKELEYKEGQWEAKMATIMQRGKDQWSAAENAFLNRWHAAKSEDEAETAAAEATWKQRIADHQDRKAAWEEDMRRRLAEKTLEEDLGNAIDDLNAEIRRNRDSLNADLPIIDRGAAINEALDRLEQQSLSRESLEGVNQSIEDFDAKVELQLRSRELGAEKIFDITKDFQKGLDRHQDNMRVMAKVQILEEYRNLIDEFVESIERQNEAYKEQTRAAALAAGYVDAGNIFIKKGLGGKNVGVVNPITPYDIRARAEEFKQSSQIYASEREFQRLMESASMPEFESILHVEKLKAQKWMQDISGTAKDAATRGSSTDCDELGDFGCWIGRAPNGDAPRMADAMAGKDVSSFGAAGKHAGVAAVINEFAGGLGEMGGESRPGMPGMPGFYLQMRFMNEQVSKKSQANIEQRGPFIDPASGAYNKVALGLHQAYHNTEVATRVHGLDRGKLTRANLGQVGKNAAQVGAMALDCATMACTPVTSSIVGGINAQIRIDTQRGGSEFRVTQESAIAATAALATAAIGGAHYSGMITEKATRAATTAVNLGSTGLQAGVREYRREGNDALAIARAGGTALLSYYSGKFLSSGSGAPGFWPGAGQSVAQSMIMDTASSAWELGRRRAGMDNYYSQSVTPGIQGFSSVIGGAMSAGMKADYQAGQSRSAQERLQNAYEAARKAADQGHEENQILSIFIGAVRDEKLARKLAAQFSKRYGEASVAKLLDFRNRIKGRRSREGKLSSGADIAAAILPGDRGVGMQKRLYQEIDELSATTGMSVEQATEQVIRAHGGDPGNALSAATMQSLAMMDADWQSHQAEMQSGFPESSPDLWETISAVQQGVQHGGDSAGVDRSHPIARYVRAEQMHKRYGDLRQKQFDSNYSIFASPLVSADDAANVAAANKRMLRESLNAQFGEGSYSEYMGYRKQMQARLAQLGYGDGFEAEGSDDGFDSRMRTLKSVGDLTLRSAGYLFNSKSWEQVRAEHNAYNMGLRRDARREELRLQHKVDRVMANQSIETRAILGLEIGRQYALGQRNYAIAEMATLDLATLGTMKAFSAGKWAFRGMTAARTGSNAHKLRIGIGAFNRFRKSRMASKIKSVAPGRAALSFAYRNKYTLNSMAINGTTSGLTKIPLDMSMAHLQGNQYGLSDAYNSFGQGFFMGAGSSAISGTRLLNNKGKILGNGLFFAGNEFYQTMPQHGWDFSSAERMARISIQAGFGMGSQALGIYGTRGSAPLTRFENSYKGRQANDLLQGTFTPMPFDYANDAFWKIVWPKMQ
ncbi:MAG: hypothetical protein CMN76_02170 [Spirochaetaceae bacterium]|nr:hypothetical protein [Spirochaetaceae bacterium]|tara:strand:- start:1032 stop:16217 length:15186 start_codon:yes stop_codon:yes gene_type:complete